MSAFRVFTPPPSRGRPGGGSPSVTNGLRKSAAARPLPRPLPQGEGRKRPAGFTLIELLAVLVIVGLLLATFVPYALSLRESSNRVRCTSNLNRIWRAVRDSYMPVNGYMWPRVRSDASNNGWTAFTGADDPNPFAATSTVMPNDVTASLWLLVREGLAQPDWFVCPSGSGTADRVSDSTGEQTVVRQRGNFRQRENLNYGYATPFSTIAEYRLNDTLPARFVLLADQAPSIDAIRASSDVRFDSSPRLLRRLNSPNHGGAGQNVLYADGSVSFETTVYCGVGRTMPTQPDDDGKWIERGDGDDIFTALAAKPLVETQPKHNEPGVASPNVGPAYRYDAFLVPGAEYVEVRAAPLAKAPAATVAALTSPAPSTRAATTIPTTMPTTSPATQP